MSSTSRKYQRDGFFVSTDKTLLQIDRIHEFLSTKAYWSIGIPRTVVSRAIEGSLCFGIYDQSLNRQIGFARVISDFATFAWVCDVYVEAEYRKRKLAQWMMECIRMHPDLQNLRRICLTTRDAHPLYESVGFTKTRTPEYWMEIKNPNIYQTTKGLHSKVDSPRMPR